MPPRKRVEQRAAKKTQDEVSTKETVQSHASKERASQLQAISELTSPQTTKPGYVIEVACAALLVACCYGYSAPLTEAAWAVTIAVAAPALAWCCCRIGMLAFYHPGQAQRYRSYTMLFATLIVAYCICAQRALPPGTMRLYAAIPAKTAAALGTGSSFASKASTTKTGSTASIWHGNILSLSIQNAKVNEKALAAEWWLHQKWYDTAITPLSMLGTSSKLIQVIVPNSRLIPIDTQTQLLPGRSDGTPTAVDLAIQCGRAANATGIFPAICKATLHDTTTYQIWDNTFKYHVTQLSGSSMQLGSIPTVASWLLKTCNKYMVCQYYIRAEYVRVCLVDVPYLAKQQLLYGAGGIIGVSLMAGFILALTCPFGIAEAVLTAVKAFVHGTVMYIVYLVLLLVFIFACLMMYDYLYPPKELTTLEKVGNVISHMPLVFMYSSSSVRYV